MERWLTFVREFHLTRDRVEERTPQEEYKLILKQLPPDWQAKIIMEESKRARGKYLVRMTNLPTIHPTALKELLETAINTTVDRVTPAAQGFYIQCPDAPTQSKVMGLAGNAFDNYIVKCSRVDPSLNADQLVDFVTERLQTQHKMQILTQSLEPTMPAKQVHQVQQQPPPPRNPGRGEAVLERVAGQPLGVVDWGWGVGGGRRGRGRRGAGECGARARDRWG